MSIYLISCQHLDHSDHIKITKMPIETLNINDIKSLYYTANLENLSSILEKGILARSVILKTEFYKKQHDISNEEVQNIRSNKNFMSPRTGKKRKLHEFANLYIQPNNAFSVVIQKETSREKKWKSSLQ